MVDENGDAGQQPQPGHVIAPGSTEPGQADAPAEQAAPMPMITPVGLPRAEHQRVVGALTLDQAGRVEGQADAPAEQTPPPPPPEAVVGTMPAMKPEPKPETPPEPTPEPPAAPAVEPTPQPAEMPAAAPAEHEDEDDGGIGWMAPEFVAHEKSPLWYLKLASAAVVLAVIIYLLTPTHDLTASSVVLVGAIFFGVYAGRHPRQMPYRVNEDGIKLGNRFHPYEEFRSFAVVPEGHLGSVIFMPLKRFAPPTTIYFEPIQEDPILDLIANSLPMEEHKPDLIDVFMRHIKF
jgi:hypothetical protein